MKKMSLFSKLIVANILYAIPVVALIYLMVAAQNVNIDFGLQEKKGLVFQEPAQKLFKILAAARFDKLDSAAAQAELLGLQKASEQVGKDLQFDSEGLKKRNRENIAIQLFSERLMKSIKNGEITKSDHVVLNQHIADIRTMITHSGDTSNLILDPDLDSYYLMDIVLLALPQTQDRIAEILNFVKNLPNGALSEENKTKISVYRALLKQSDIDRVVADLDTTLNEDPNFYGTLPSLKNTLAPAVKNYISKGEIFLAELENIKKTTDSSSRNEAFAAGADFFESSFSSWYVSASELDKLIAERVASLQSARTQSLFWSLLALLSAVVVLFWISSTFNSDMRRILESLQGSIEETQKTGTELVKMSERLSDVSSNQAFAIQMTSSAVSEIDSMAKATLSHVTDTKKYSNEGFDQANSTAHSVQNLLQAISDISESNQMVLSQVETNKKEMEQIVKFISDIGNKTRIINEIVFQTKLLSFNASVEAARAGEYGKGFAVVAEEVGSLAQMSGNASKEISSLLDTSINTTRDMSNNSTHRINSLVSGAKQKVEQGSELATECSSSIQAIQSRIQSILEASESIYKAATEQSKGIDEVAKSLEQINMFSQENMSMAKQTAEHSKVLAEQAQSLKKLSKVVECVVMGEDKSNSTVGNSFEEFSSSDASNSKLAS